MRMFGVVTPIFLLMNVLVYLACVYIYQPTDLAVNVYAISEKRQYYRFLTSMFTHFGITHLLGNMVILIALGARIENIIGRLNYVIVYIVTGLAAAFASYINFFVMIYMITGRCVRSNIRSPGSACCHSVLQ